MKRMLFLLPIVSYITGFSQTAIKGTVTTTKGQPVVGANIYIKDSYDGTSSDANGNYSFTTTESDSQILVTTYLGYEDFQQKIFISGKPIELKIVMKDKINELNAVVVAAGEFEASDRKRLTILSPLDIVTTAGGNGDTYGALRTLPGTQQIGDETGLFVRGGDASEAKTFIDGVQVPDPFFTSVPDIPQRGRFSPFLFKGTYFSTGGYSAQYGEAMSSALVLETQDLPDRTTTDIGLMSVGVSIGHDHLFNDKKTSLGLYGSYINLTPYFALVNQRYDFPKAPEAGDFSLIFRQKTSATGMLKAFASYDLSSSEIKYPNLDDTLDANAKFPLNVKNQNFFSNISYKELIAKQWTFFVSASFSHNHDQYIINTIDTINNTRNVAQGRITLTKSFGSLSVLRFGAEYQHPELTSIFNQYSNSYTDNFLAPYVEGDIYITQKLVARLGARMEYSSLLDKLNLAPRTSIAYKTGKASQVSFAFGQFYQMPDDSFLFYGSQLGFQRADHYILNFQTITEKRTFRIEAYYKTYHDLVKTYSGIEVVKAPDNAGDGYARGFDIFWRDKKTIPFADYWISYSFLDTKRNYLDYPAQEVPPFAAKHTVSVVYKQLIPMINMNVNITYTWATGRTYYNPNNPVFLGDKTPDYNNFSLSFNYLTTIWKNFTVFVFSVDNIFGSDNIYSYRYSDYVNAQGIYPSVAVKDPAARSFFIGIFMSIGEDKGSDE